MKLLLKAFLLLLLGSFQALQAAELALKSGERIKLTISGIGEDANQISGIYTISYKGSINLPYIKEQRAVGLKPSELQTKLEKAYIQAEYFTNPTITVISDVEGAKRQVFLVSGVKNNGAVDFTDNLTTFQAISVGGGFDPFSHPSKTKLIRNGVTKILDLSKHTPEVDVKLEPGDQIIVPD